MTILARWARTAGASAVYRFETGSHRIQKNTMSLTSLCPSRPIARESRADVQNLKS